MPTGRGHAARDASATEGITYHYRVTALDSAGNESARSVAVSGTFWDLTPPSAVTGVAVTPTEYGFEVHWDANPTADLARYVVRPGELQGDEEGQWCSLYPGYDLGADTTSYAYTTLPDGEERCFIVDAVDDAGNSSFEWTGEARVVTATELDMTPSVSTPEGSPVELTATSKEAGVELSWHPVTDATATRSIAGTRTPRRTRSWRPRQGLPTRTPAPPRAPVTSTG
ncbi:fibronectin type III domain-containing protein [Streptomyces sp. NPDC093676]|uniref:hypothetical protein n=1 Tax=Streptomyces sp. NPDC093676 TaxID=3366050 RepID=UPI00382A19F7